jgi:predicted metalloenzyme YecM
MKDYKIFLDTIFENIKTAGLDVKGLKLDHVAYYTATKEEYDQIKPEFEKLGRFDHEAIIGNRRVGVIKLNHPFVYDSYKIEAAELIEPKEGEEHSSGWEHAEFVTDEEYEDILKRYPNVKWETSSMDRPIYSHVTAILDKDLKVKFHHNSILECIKLEKSQEIEK